MGGQEKRKDRKTRKSKTEEKVVSFSSVSLFPCKEMGGSHSSWKSWNHLNRGIDHLTWGKTQGAGMVKGWEDK